MSSKNINTRERILEAAWKLLESNLGKGVRMSDIAKAVGITRQALYLHFSTRAELLIATTQYLDEVKGIDERLKASRAAVTGVERLEAFIAAWGNYIPEIYGIAKALLAVYDTDEAAAKAWDNRMQAMRQGCEAAIKALNDDGMLTDNYSQEKAVDILWTMLSIRNWEQWCIDCGWSQHEYVDAIKLMSRDILVKG